MTNRATEEGQIERIVQSKRDSCHSACVAMLSGIDEQDLIDEYGIPMKWSESIDILEDHYDYVNLHPTSIHGVRALAYLAEAMIVSVESPIKERDPDLHAELLEEEKQRREEECRRIYDFPTDKDIKFHRSVARIQHAFVVYRGRIYDPRDPPYWPSLGCVPHIGYEEDYEVQKALVCTNHETALSPDESLPRLAAGIDSPDDVPSYRNGGDNAE